MSGPLILDKPIVFEPYSYEGGEILKLPEVQVGKAQSDFLEVFTQRRSVKQLGACPIEALSEVLFLATKPYSIGKDDYGMTVYCSAAPSAGGRHPIDVIVGLKEQNDRQLYLYQPIGHSLKLLTVAKELQRNFFNDVEQTLSFGESTLLWFSVQYMRTASKYTDYMSLVWRDVGAQLCCLQQAAKYVGIDSCPIGYLAEESFNKMFKSEKLLSGGGLILGKKVIINDIKKYYLVDTSDNIERNEKKQTDNCANI